MAAFASRPLKAENEVYVICSANICDLAFSGRFLLPLRPLRRLREALVFVRSRLVGQYLERVRP
jgi:hypothetical protein